MSCNWSEAGWDTWTPGCPGALREGSGALAAYIWVTRSGRVHCHVSKPMLASDLLWACRILSLYKQALTSTRYEWFVSSYTEITAWLRGSQYCRPAILGQIHLHLNSAYLFIFQLQLRRKGRGGGGWGVTLLWPEESNLGLSWALQNGKLSLNKGRYYME